MTEALSDAGNTDGAPGLLAAPPLLRPPPFPGARPKGRPVRRLLLNAPSDALKTGLGLQQLVEAIRDARVGGSFWAGTPDVLATTDRPVTGVLQANGLGKARQRLAGVTVDKSLVMVHCPGRRPAPLRAAEPNVVVVSCPLDPWPVLDQAGWIMAAADDEWALLGAVAGVPVLDPDSGRQIPAAALMRRLAWRVAHYDYFDPFDGEPIDALAWVGILADWRRGIDANQRLGAVVGIAGWKREAIGRLLWAGRPARLVRRLDPVRVSPGQAIGAWPSRTPRRLLARARVAGVPVACIEDGFIRSLGLGALLHPPASITVDFTGAPFDPRRASDLESLLNETEFSAALLNRAERLIHLLREGRVTKYAAGAMDAVTLPPARRRILVPGQVEDDLSVRLGRADVDGNLDLLRRVRAMEPDAWIAYKPHPDVAAGLRRGAIRDADALRFADAVLPSASMAALLDAIDAVHVLTSLAGFEALLRGREVVVHGQPFYAGWGLTTDMAPKIARRRRRLQLAELVAGALILYPRYLDPETRLPCPPEVLVERHRAMPAPPAHFLTRLRRVQGQLALRWRGRTQEAA